MGSRPAEHDHQEDEGQQCEGQAACAQPKGCLLREEASIVKQQQTDSKLQDHAR